MTAQPRHAGRPVRDEEIGRNVILEKTRLAMRERPRADLQRNEIARYAGVTPALISYYFPDRSHLFEAAAHPVIEIYVAEARLIIGSDQPLIHRLNALILLFVEFNYKEGHLLDFYLEHMSRTGCKNDIVMLEGINKDLLIFFRRSDPDENHPWRERRRHTVHALGHVQAFCETVGSHPRRKRSGNRGFHPAQSHCVERLLSPRRHRLALATKLECDRSLRLSEAHCHSRVTSGSR